MEHEDERTTEEQTNKKQNSIQQEKQQHGQQSQTCRGPYFYVNKVEQDQL